MIVTTAKNAPYQATVKQRRLDLMEVQECLRSLSPDHPDSVERALARYLTVRSVGYIEAIRDDLADLYASTTGNARLHRRVKSNLRTGLGVTPDQLLTFVGSFDPAWRITLESKLDAEDQELRNRLGAMVAARKKIAHGDGDQVTSGKSLAWSDAALTIGKELQGIIFPEL
ncbi:hypothetical protein [Tsukamurella pseudospumae]|uniref:hypothetical protein n=1 Tax=Tsukamurella pseudospumae TaxID=239498 RepID=UPI0012E8505C|nr:hypothetical protein [Tsukamurella pseudospumae]